MALLAELINNIPQSLAYKNKKSADFLPDFLKEREQPIMEKSLEQQAREWADFKTRYEAAQRKM